MPSKAYRLKNKAKIAKQNRAYNKKNKTKIAKRRRAYNIRTKAKRAAYAFLYRNRNKKRFAAWSRAWHLKNPSGGAHQARARRARQVGAKGSHTRHDIDRLYIKQRGRCAALHCGVSLAHGYHVDHKTPLSRGGSNYPRNLQLMCQPCNDSKGARTMKEWARYLGYVGVVL